MSHAELENLSALADGELTDDELRFLLRRTEHDGALRGLWVRYHIVRAHLRREAYVLADDGFAERVMAGIASEPRQRVVHRGHRWLRWSAGGALAAGVAAVALIVVPPQMRRTTTPTVAPGQASIAAAKPAAAAPRMQAPTAPRWLSASPSAARMAQPAAADFLVGRPQRVVRPRTYARHLNPYLALPGYRAPTAMQAQRIMHQLWSMAPRRQMAPKKLVLHAQVP